MKIDIYYNDFQKQIEIDVQEKIGKIQEKLLSFCNLLIYNIEYTEVLFDNNNKYILGSDDLPFENSLYIYLENDIINSNENIEKKLGNLVNFKIYERKRDELGNVIKNNHIIDKYNKWYETEEQNNFNINFSIIPFSNDNINYERSIIRYPINNILHNIFNISNLENINNSSELDEDNKILDQEKESEVFEESKEFVESGENNIELNNQENSLENIINTIDNYFKNCHNNNLEEQNINDELFQENNTLIPIEEDYSDLPDLINVSYDFPSILNYYLEEDIIIALNDEEFDKLDKIKYKEDTIEKTNKECLICLDNFMEDDEIIKIKCNHIFHTNCIKHWLCKESNKCPICRIEVGKGLPINI